MAERLSRISEIGEYAAYHFSATQSATLIAPDHTHGSFVGVFIVNKAGTSDVVTLSNGASSPIAIISPVAGGNYRFECVCDKGLYVTIAGTAGDYTITANAMAV